ncbi:lamin tail domain-containing protein [Haladaptatus caseinilyticus]|uniref:lamin tail domain-containing protein n=1 Tax=Haladaptatus caseinilyticus TaxID=2993314 RepID=UPI00224B31D5|nr:lamin tail domain-containing protein [Haladaptatus caseinilyticus]
MRAQHALCALVLAALVVFAGCTSSGPLGAQTDSTTATAPTSPLEVHFINVGQSSSTLVVSPTGETMLIDTGDWRNDGEYVLQYLRRHDIERIDHLVTSHSDADHIGGNAAVIEYYETQASGIGAVYDPGIASSSGTYQRYLNAVERYNVPLYQIQAGDPLRFDGAAVTVLGPPNPFIANRERNENSIILKVVYGKTSFLLPGDAGQQEEQYLVDQYGSRLNSTVLFTAHHGSRSSTNDAFLDLVTPQIAVISSAYDSQYGHPHEETLTRLAARGVPTYWTAVHGNIVLSSTGERITVKTQAKAPTDPQSLRTAPPIDPGTTEVITTRTTIDTGSTGDSSDDTPTTTATPAATTSRPASTIQLAEVHADAAGSDAENLNDEYIVLENTGTTPHDLSGWKIRDTANHSYTVPRGTILEPSQRITLHSGSDENTNTDYYWNSEQPIWNNGGDTVIIVDTEGTTVVRETYE